MNFSKTAKLNDDNHSENDSVVICLPYLHLASGFDSAAFDMSSGRIYLVAGRQKVLNQSPVASSQ
jgi:predicted component of type VI protein secretion system